MIPMLIKLDIRKCKLKLTLMTERIFMLNQSPYRYLGGVAQ